MSWAGDFSYGYFRRILEAVRPRFRVHPIAEAPVALAAVHRPLLFLRHDVDVDLGRAAALAEIEAGMGTPATYMVLPSGLLYNLTDSSSRGFLRRILDCGGEIGLHFDCPEHLRSIGAKADDLAGAIAEACRSIEDATGFPVRSLSFHRPIPSLLRGPMFVAGRVNAYAAELMETYWSDSKGNWREGEPIPKLTASGWNVVQLLTHPIWWGRDHVAAADRLQEFFEGRTRNASPSARGDFSDALARTLPGISRRSA